MSAGHVASLVLLACGTAVTVASCVGALGLRRVYDRLHFLAPITSLGAPLIGLGLALANGWGETTAQILLTVFLLGVSGPALQAATGRVAVQREGLDTEAADG